MMLGTVRTVPIFDGPGCPCCRLVLMAIMAGVGCPKTSTEIRPGYTETVIMAKLDFHIIASRHMTADTLCAACFHLVKMMSRIIVFWFMTLHAKLIIFCRKNKFERMRIVAIHALYSFFIHFAL